MADVSDTITCPLCSEQHEVIAFAGGQIIPCPTVPEGMTVDANSLRQFAVRLRLPENSLHKSDNCA